MIILLLLGRWIERREGKERVTTKELVVVTAAITALTADKAECDDVTVLTARVDKMADVVGALEVAQAAQQEKVKGVAAHVADLHREVHNR